MRGKLTAGVLVSLLAAIAVAGCGGSTVSQAVDPVARAAQATAKVSGYRMRAQMAVTTPQATVRMTMDGAVNTAAHAGTIVEQMSILGHTLTEHALFRGTTFYMRVPQVPGVQQALAQMTGGRPWLRFDLSGMLGGLGMGSMPTATNPAQFVDYLRAVSSRTRRVGTATIGGVPTIHYHAIIDLESYPRLVPAAERPAIRRGTSLLESEIGSHTFPMDVWIDSNRMVRQFSFSMSTCAAGQRSHMTLTGDVYDFGPQATPTPPPDSRTYDLTPVIQAEMSRLRVGCATSA